MSRIPPKPDPVTEAEQALREYLHLALSGRFLALQTEDILDAAEFVWNNYEPRVGPPSAGASISLCDEDPEPGETQEELSDALIEDLHRVREERFGEMSFFVIALDCMYEKDDVFITCDLMWADGSAIHPFELRHPRQFLSPPGRS